MRNAHELNFQHVLIYHMSKFITTSPRGLWVNENNMYCDEACIIFQAEAFSKCTLFHWSTTDILVIASLLPKGVQYEPVCPGNPQWLNLSQRQAVYSALAKHLPHFNTLKPNTSGLNFCLFKIYLCLWTQLLFHFTSNGPTDNLLTVCVMAWPQNQCCYRSTKPSSINGPQLVIIYTYIYKFLFEEK